MFAVSDQFDWSLPQPQVGNKLFWERHTFPIGQNWHDSIINWPFINLLPGGHCRSTVRQAGKPDLCGAAGDGAGADGHHGAANTGDSNKWCCVWIRAIGANVTLKVDQLPLLKAAPSEAHQIVLLPRLSGPAPDRSRSKLSVQGKNSITSNEEMPVL